MIWIDQEVVPMGQAGAILAKAWRTLNESGVVLGVCALPLRTEEKSQVSCLYCAKEPQQVVSLELKSKPMSPVATPLISTSLCLPLCSACYSSLIGSLLLSQR